MWKAKQLAISEIFGDWDASYNDLPRFMAALQKYNTGTIVKWCTISTTNPNERIFWRVFWAFSPCIEGFNYFGPVMSIDGTHLYGKYTGKLLIAMGVDANNQIFPLAFAIVEEESYSSWSWFLKNIRVYVTQRDDLCLIFDRHKGILKAVNEEGSRLTPPHAYHRYCSRHFISNFNQKFKDAHLKQLVGKASNANQMWKFDHLMNEIKKVSELAHTWLQNEPYERWALAHDGASKIEGGLVKATTHSVTPFNENVGIFQVATRNGRTQIVRVDEETCTCGKWQIFHYPCSQVMAACQSFGINSWQYIASYYAIEHHVQTWSPQFFPLLQEEYWPPSALRCDILKPNPNLVRCKKGRPSSSRIRNEMDIREGDKTKKRCGICKQLGHDRRTCPTKTKQPAR